MTGHRQYRESNTMLLLNICLSYIAISSSTGNASWEIQCFNPGGGDGFGIVIFWPLWRIIFWERVLFMAGGGEGEAQMKKGLGNQFF